MRGNPSHHPPPPCVAPRFGDSPTWGNAKLSRQTPKWVARMGGGGYSATFQITQQWSNISRCLFHTKTCIPCPLLIAVSKFAHLLSMCCKERKGGLYSEAEPINRRQQPVSVDYTTFYRQHLCGGSVHKNKVGHNSTQGTVSFLLSFLLNLLLHKVYISNILCGLRLWIQDAYSKKKPFISNVHINILMNISLKNSPVVILLSYKDVSPVVSCWRCSLF